MITFFLYLLRRFDKRFGVGSFVLHWNLPIPELSCKQIRPAGSASADENKYVSIKVGLDSIRKSWFTQPLVANCEHVQNSKQISTGMNTFRKYFRMEEKQVETKCCIVFQSYDSCVDIQTLSLYSSYAALCV